uniref:KH domain-containing protein n=1 Tax=Panagrellus redivivus TaxID=6233 RepID=A0A7E4W018_PANRE
MQRYSCQLTHMSLKLETKHRVSSVSVPIWGRTGPVYGQHSHRHLAIRVMTALSTMELNPEFLQQNGSAPSVSPTASLANGQASPNGSAGTSNGGTPQMSVVLTIRLLMQSKEVGSIIGKKGDHVRQIREKSGAKVNISDGSCPERIVTITGNVATIHKAFSMICKKSEEDLQALPNSVPQPPITMRLIVPATQCGSLIGKRGSKIKEIRESTGAAIQVATEMLPTSTERAVTISGTCNAIIDCMQEICTILLEAPPKGTNLPFRPKPSYNPLLIASSAAAAAAAQQQATQHLTAVMQQQQQQQHQLQASQVASVQGYNPAMVSQELARLQPYLAVPRFNLPAGLFQNPALANGLVNLPGTTVACSAANGMIDPTSLFQKDPAAAAIFWAQQQQQLAAAQHAQQAAQQGSSESEKQQAAQVAAAQAAAAMSAQGQNGDQTFDYMQSFAQPYLLNNSMLAGRTMGVGGTPLKPETSSAAAAVLQSSAAARQHRFSPY